MRKISVKNFDFVGNIAVLMSGKTLAAAIALITVPIVARLFSPDDFGVAAAFVSVIGILSTISTLSYSGAIVVPAEESEAFSLMAVCYRIAFTLSILLMLAIGSCELIGTPIPMLEILGPWVWILPLGLLLQSAIQIQEAWLTREKSFKRISTSLVVGNSSTGISRIAIGAAYGSSVLGLIAGFFFGLLCKFGVQRPVFDRSWRAISGDLSWTRIRQSASQYSDFPKFNAPAGFIFELGQSLPILLFGSMYSPAIAGFYAMANRLGQMPTTIGAASVRQVFLQKASELRNKGGDLRRSFLTAILSLAAIGALPFLFLWAFGQEIIEFLLGPNWFEAGGYLEIMAPWLFMVWVAAPCNPIFVVLRRQKLWLFLASGLTLLRLTTFGVSFIVGADPEWALAAFVATTVAGSFMTISAALILVTKYRSGQTHQ